MLNKFRYKHFALLVKECRTSSNLTQHSLAVTLGMDFSGNGQFISNTERGLCAIPPQYWKRMSKKLHIPLEQIVDAYLADEKRKLEFSMEHNN